ncbi:hypothetical protein EUGRSUZ_H03951 [Eucalyptus grandis]|uniref:Uncharacterized protein n=2 Tax=Eucalyptus grandis TaxID=71139 RepID=A0ACC3JVK8_EUCGR|nr:hypothetical protein EUGRSUZ_H03951 [Eucalyptus grandis]
MVALSFVFSLGLFCVWPEGPKLWASFYISTYTWFAITLPFSPNGIKPARLEVSMQAVSVHPRPEIDPQARCELMD